MLLITKCTNYILIALNVYRLVIKAFSTIYTMIIR
nr:MAG TPA: hypothetical protein [Crassvirales sp.]